MIDARLAACRERKFLIGRDMNAVRTFISATTAPENTTQVAQVRGVIGIGSRLVFDGGILPADRKCYVAQIDVRLLCLTLLCGRSPSFQQLKLAPY
jgi:hypothetical protein